MNSLPQAITDLIEEFTQLPGIGPKSAARIVFFLQKAPLEFSQNLAKQLIESKVQAKVCKQCYNLSDEDMCPICADPSRNNGMVLVVEDALDLVAIENAGVFKGLYHVLGGVISPMNGIGPEEIRIAELLRRLLANTESIELIIGTNPNIEGEATALYIENEIVNSSFADRVTVTRLARGLSTGADIDYTDETTIKRAFEGRA